MDSLSEMIKKKVVKVVHGKMYARRFPKTGFQIKFSKSILGACPSVCVSRLLIQLLVTFPARMNFVIVLVMYSCILFVVIILMFIQ